MEHDHWIEGTNKIVDRYPSCNTFSYISIDINIGALDKSLFFGVCISVTINLILISHSSKISFYVINQTGLLIKDFNFMIHPRKSKDYRNSTKVSWTFRQPEFRLTNLYKQEIAKWFSYYKSNSIKKKKLKHIRFWQRQVTAHRTKTYSTINRFRRILMLPFFLILSKNFP